MIEPLLSEDDLKEFSAESFDERLQRLRAALLKSERSYMRTARKIAPRTMRLLRRSERRKSAR
jgi:hypothetical protein